MRQLYGGFEEALHFCGKSRGARDPCFAVQGMHLFWRFMGGEGCGRHLFGRGVIQGGAGAGVTLGCRRATRPCVSMYSVSSNAQFGRGEDPPIGHLAGQKSSRSMGRRFPPRYCGVIGVVRPTGDALFRADGGTIRATNIGHAGARLPSPRVWTARPMRLRWPPPARFSLKRISSWSGQEVGEDEIVFEGHDGPHIANGQRAGGDGFATKKRCRGRWRPPRGHDVRAAPLGIAR